MKGFGTERTISSEAFEDAVVPRFDADRASEIAKCLEIRAASPSKWKSFLLAAHDDRVAGGIKMIVVVLCPLLGIVGEDDAAWLSG